MPTYRLTLCYDGTRYDGWQKQGNTPKTIQQRLEAALSEALSQPVEVAGSGRTDAGVHARAQTASFRADTALSCGEILSALRSRLPEDVGAVSLEEAPPRFHARLNCKGKTYVYRVWNSESPNVFERRFLHFQPEPLDLDAMRKAADCLAGRHDFSAFCANPRLKKSAVRTLQPVVIERLGEEVRLRMTGSGFLYNMARIIAGTLLQVGLGLLDAAALPGILAAGDRALAGPTAPAKGLTLWEVYY